MFLSKTFWLEINQTKFINFVLQKFCVTETGRRRRRICSSKREQAAPKHSWRLLWRSAWCWVSHVTHHSIYLVSRLSPTARLMMWNILKYLKYEICCATRRTHEACDNRQKQPVSTPLQDDGLEKASSSSTNNTLKGADTTKNFWNTTFPILIFNNG